MIDQEILKEVEQAESYLIKAGEILNTVKYKLNPTTAKPPELTNDTITWTKTTGPNGDYEKATVQQNKDFTALQERIDKNQGKLKENGYFYWVFRDGAIGRKPNKPF